MTFRGMTNFLNFSTSNSPKTCHHKVFSNMYSGPLEFKGCRKLQVCRDETWEMFGCTRFRGNTWMSHPLVCHWVLSASDCLKRALCFSGLNHSGLKERTCSTSVDSVSWANRQMEVCVCLWAYCIAIPIRAFSSIINLCLTNALKPVYVL